MCALCQRYGPFLCKKNILYVSFMCGFMWVLCGFYAPVLCGFYGGHKKEISSYVIFMQPLCACCPSPTVLFWSYKLPWAGFEPWPEEKRQDRVRHWFKVHAKNRKTYHSSRQRETDLYITAAVQNLSTVEIFSGIITECDTYVVNGERTPFVLNMQDLLDNEQRSSEHPHESLFSTPRTQTSEGRRGRRSSRVAEWRDSHARCRGQ